MVLRRRIYLWHFNSESQHQKFCRIHHGIMRENVMSMELGNRYAECAFPQFGLHV